MSRDPLREGWRYYGCAAWGCDAVNPDYQAYGTRDGRSWCLHHKPGRVRRFLLSVLGPLRTFNRQGEPMLPMKVVRRHYVLMQTHDGALERSTVKREDRGLCKRVLVGMGTDTWDPICVLPSGHAGPCRGTPQKQR